MSDTPRTDAALSNAVNGAAYRWQSWKEHYKITSDFARQLERELRDLQAQLECWNGLPQAIHDMDNSFPANHPNPQLGIAASYALLINGLAEANARAELALRHLTNLQPHIAQLPEKWRPFIDADVDMAMQALKQ